MQKVVTVRNKKDHNDVREMTEFMYNVMQADFEIVENQADEVDPNDKSLEAIKKKAVGDVVVKPAEHIETEFVNITDNGGPSLAEQYEAIAGKAPDKRWKEARIQAEIDKLNQ